MKERIAQLARELGRLCQGRDRRIQLMEVCGTHTVAVFRTGLRALLPPELRLVSGPGCPVCVTPQRHIDAAIELATQPGVILATYGDMIRVPGRSGSLERLRAQGAAVRVVNSARTALELARTNPERPVVFLGVGFETTAPATAATVREHLDGYSFHLAAEALYTFVWQDFCDWYVEIAKIRLQTSPGDGVKGVLYHVLCEILKLLHPFVPFITEEIWQVLGEKPASVSATSFPEPGRRDEEAEQEMERVKRLVGGVRSIRAEWNVPAEVELSVLVKAEPLGSTGSLLDKLKMCKGMTGPTQWTISPDLSAPKGSARAVFTDAELFVPLAGLIDVEVERKRLGKELAQVSSDLARAEGNLSNRGFLDRAPGDVVAKERAKREEFVAKRDRLEANLAVLGE